MKKILQKFSIWLFRKAYSLNNNYRKEKKYNNGTSGIIENFK